MKGRHLNLLTSGAFLFLSMSVSSEAQRGVARAHPARAMPMAAARPAAPSFRNHVLPVLTRAGCNSGACHGALAGKGGLKLSLRGFDPDSDYNALTRQAAGRRIVNRDPAHSLALLKPSFQVPHGGGMRLKPGSPDYRLVSDWIRAGCPAPRADDPRLTSLQVSPESATLKRGQTRQIVVRARYTNGRVEDVTRWVKFGTSDSLVTTVDEDGRAKAAGPGEAAITVWFNSKVAFARIQIPFGESKGTAARESRIENRGSRGAGRLSSPNTHRQTPTTQRRTPDTQRLTPNTQHLLPTTHNSTPAPQGPGLNAEGYIDSLIDRKLRELNLPASPPCTDSEFIRRAFLDAAGILPTISETRAFLADARPDKRQRLVDSLLARSEYVDYWTYKWCDLLLVSSRKVTGKPLASFYNWVRGSVQQNKPWDRFAREIITARGSTVENGAANYFVLHKEPIDLTETTTQAFLGMSVQCARCHNHPLEKWTQRDYYQFANLFARVRLKNGDQGDVLVLSTADGNVNHPRLGVPLPPRPLDGQPISLTDVRDRREALADWLTSRQNPYFARALVNRVWRALMGRGLVEPEDDLRLTNPPSNQPLFDALAADFAGHGFNVRRLIRQIMTSNAYGRSSNPAGINARDDRYYSRYLVRRLPAEVILDAVSQVTAIPTEYPGYAAGTRALQLRDSQVASYFLTAFGRPERNQTCSCERTQEPSVAQALHLVNGDTINQKLRASSGVIEGLFNAHAGDEEALDELFLSALSRFPTAAEKAKLRPLLAEAPVDDLAPLADQRATRRAALEDLYWAVLTDREFLFNH